MNEKLENLAIALEKNSTKSAFNIFAKKNSLKGLYIYGSVGCGKTTLMKKFYNSLTKTNKIYFHFNSFMQSIHQALRNIRSENKKYDDELIEAVKRVALGKKLLCFDEFQVLDIADAMLLGRIFSYLFLQQTIVIFTSNSKPQDLYSKGLQREVFLEFVNKILLKNCEVFFLDNHIDYRQLYCQNLAQRYFIVNKENEEKIAEIIANFTNNKMLEPKTVKVWGRGVIIKKTYKNIAIINFKEVCCTELAAADYKAIAQEFSLIFLLELPVLTAQEVNESRRFTLFIDEIYENKTALIILAKTKIDDIYNNQNGQHFYARTLSRLKEIKSDHYWHESKISKII